MNDAQERKLCKGIDVLQRERRLEARLAGRSTVVRVYNEGVVAHEYEEGKPVRDACGNRGTRDAEVEFVDEEVVEEGVERGCDEQSVGPCAVETLRLEEFLHVLELYVAQTTRSEES